MNEAAIVLANKISEIHLRCKADISTLEKQMSSISTLAQERVESLTVALKEVCTHVGMEPVFADDTYFCYHNNCDRGDHWAKCSLCGCAKRITETEYKTKFNPFI